MSNKINKILLIFISIFFLFFIWSTIELYFQNIIDLDGDATYYFESAINKLYNDNFYPLYPLFITYIGLDNPFFTRFAQFLFLLLITITLFNNINKREWNYTVIKMFKIFYVTNFGIYLLMIQLVRDWMLFSFTAISLVLFTSEKKSRLNIFFASISIIILFPLSQTLPLILLTAYFITYLQFNLFKQKKIITTLMFILFSFILYYIFRQNINNILERSYDIIGGEKVLVDDSAKSNFILGFFNFLFGPGLIRPLFPAKYYLVYTIYFSFLTWISCLSFMIQFALSSSFVFDKSLTLNFSKNFYIYLYTFLIYVSIYVATFGGPGGLRKRMLAYFIFILLTCELFSKNKLFPIKSYNFLKFLFVLFILIFITSVFSL
jgi:hypothetical protein